VNNHMVDSSQFV